MDVFVEQKDTSRKPFHPVTPEPGEGCTIYAPASKRCWRQGSCILCHLKALISLEQIEHKFEAYYYGEDDQRQQ
ncbi:hypothetical protein [Paenibacillus sp. N3.4]|uniref:hypothetical protein n=1 Tax=Paenibacillus sp. N3.4 TaxID=2603222 RepID=UPI00164FA115|nr:hypothetical protein [Paenibacillus sp. N3.4]